jgi:hypothetical protein
LLAALSFLGMLAVFAFGNSPLNQQIASWTPESLPADWAEVRDAWDRFYAISSILAAVAFTVLLVSLLGRCHQLGSRPLLAVKRAAGKAVDRDRVFPHKGPYEPSFD